MFGNLLNTCDDNSFSINPPFYRMEEAIKLCNIDLDETSSMKIEYMEKLIGNIIENRIISITLNKLYPSIDSNLYSEDESNMNSEDDWIDNFTEEEISELDMVFDMNFYMPPKKRYPVKVKITSRKKASPPVISPEDI